MRGIIRYWAAVNVWKWELIFRTLWRPPFFTVIQVSAPVFIFFKFFYFFFFPPLVFFSVCWLAGVRPPTQAFLTPNLCSCKSALRKKPWRTLIAWGSTGPSQPLCRGSSRLSPTLFHTSKAVIHVAFHKKNKKSWPEVVCFVFFGGSFLGCSCQLQLRCYSIARAD